VALKLNSALILLSSSILKPIAIIIIIIVIQSHIENYARNYKERATLKKLAKTWPKATFNGKKGQRRAIIILIYSITAF